MQVLLSHFILQYSRIPRLDMDFFAVTRIYQHVGVCVCEFILPVRVCVREEYCNISLLNYRSVVVELCSLHVPHAS